MTSVMRSNFEIYSQYISVDAIKSKTNDNLFPYMAIVVTEDMNKVQVCCETLIFSERHEAYNFMINSTFEMAPKVAMFLSWITVRTVRVAQAENCEDAADVNSDDSRVQKNRAN